MLLFQEIRAAGYLGGYGQVKRYVRTVLPRPVEAPVQRFGTPPSHQGQVGLRSSACLGASGTPWSWPRLLHRLLHRCHIVNIRGNSYRMRRHDELSKTIHPLRSRINPDMDSGEAGSYCFESRNAWVLLVIGVPTGQLGSPLVMANAHGGQSNPPAVPSATPSPRLEREPLWNVGYQRGGVTMGSKRTEVDA